MKPFFKTTLFGTALLLSSTSITQALDKDAFIASFEQYVAASGLSGFTYEKSDMDGNTITLYNARADHAPLTNISFGDIVFNKIEEIEGKGYVIGASQIARMEMQYKSSRIELENLSTADSYLPAEDAVNASWNRAPYTFQTVEQIKVSGKGQATLTLSDISTRISQFKADESSKVEIKARSFELDPAAAAQEFRDLGYDKITGRFDGYFSGNVKTGDMSVSNFVISAKDVGTLAVNMKLGGFTQAAIEKLGKFKTNGKPSEAAAMSLMAQAKFTSYSLRFEDSSLTNRILDMVARQQDLSRDEVITLAKVGLKQTENQLGEAKIGKKLSSEVTAFLQNPKTLEASFSPSQPVPFLTIMLGVMTSPADLLDELNADIIANK